MEDRWVVIVAGGMAFNNGNVNTAGKSVFVINASTGDLIWMIGYNAAGATDLSSTPYIDTATNATYTGLTLTACAT